MENLQPVGRPNAKHWTSQRKSKFVSMGLFVKTHHQPLLLAGGVRDSAVHHVLIKSSNTDAKPCMQKYPEKHAYRSWRTVRCGLFIQVLFNWKFQVHRARWRQGAAGAGAGTCLGCVYWKEGISGEPGPFPWGFALFYWVKKRSKKEQRGKEKPHVFPRNVLCLQPYLFFKPASKEVGRINQLCFVRPASEIGCT